MISILDRKSDAMIGWISRVITDSHQDSIKNEEVYNCTISRTEPHASLISKRERIIIPSEEGDYREFVVQSTRESTVSNSKEVYCTGSFLDLNKLKLIEPQILEGQTAYTSASFVLAGIKEWELGVVEYSEVFKWVIEAHLKGHDALKAISILSGLELKFRITTDGINVTGRYIDFIKRRGMNRGKEIVFGKDLMGITRRINSERIITSLKVIAPDKSDGTSTKVTVMNDAAFQNWNHKGEHLIDVYEPDVDPDISVEELTKIGEKELQKRIDAVVEYDIDSVSLDHVLGYEHEIIRMGDTAYIKDEYFNPPLYLNARAIFIDRSVFYKAHKKYKLGEVIEYKKEDIMKTWRGLQKIYGAKIISSPTPPPGRKDVLWIKTGGSVEIAHRWDSILKRWLPVNGSMTWIMYAENENGLNMSPDATGKTYIGFAYNQTEETPSMDPLDYNWSLFQGPQGVEGPTGPNGEPTFTWIKYATSITGANMDDNPTDKSYIGIAYNQPSQTESSDPAVYTWALFKGPKGEPGYTPVKGTDYFDGEKGTTGTSSYLWVRYSQNVNGSGMVTSPTDAKYVGIATTTTAVAPTGYTSYSWSLIKGTDGIEGEPGTDGNTSYLHIKYSNDGGSTLTANAGETVGDWIGTYVDFTVTDSTNTSSYTWNKVKGDKGNDGYTPVKGTDYFDGDKGQDGTSSYLWVRYSQNINGNPMTTSPANALYVGIATTTTAVAPTGYASYSWSLIKGTDGIEGEPGTDGKTSYLHIKYSNDGGVTLTVNSGETVGDWIGTYVDFVSTDSTSVSAYTWNKVKGEKGNDGYTPVKGTDYFDGEKGTTGTSSYLWVRYSQNADGSGMVTSPTNAKYVGIATTTTATAPTITTAYAWSLIKGTDGIEGEPGTDGNTSYLHIKYSDNGTTFTANNGETVGAYIGTYVDFIAADSLTFATYTWNKVKGETGPPGKGITSIVEQYYLSTSATTQVGGVWSTTVPAWVDGRYMWTRSVITYTDTTTTTTTPVNATGGKGGTGGDGVGISNIDVQYYLSTSATALVGGSWVTTSPAWVDGKYIWSKTVTTYTNSTTDESAPANITGGKGATGPGGEPGKGVTSIVEEYYYSTSATTQVGGAWSTTVPAWVDGKFMWTRAKTTFTDATVVYTTPVNVTGQKGTDGVTTYTWVKYADDANGSGIADVPTGKRFMGIAVNKTTATESSTAGDYLWSPLYDNVVVGGRNLFQDSKMDRASTRHIVFNTYDILAEHVGKDVTISFDIKGQYARTILLYPYQNNGVSIEGSYSFIPSITEFTRVTFSTKVKDWGINNVAWTLGSIALYDNVGAHNYTVRNIKIELGNVATDWTASPEDVKAEADAAAKAYTDITLIAGGKVFNNPEGASVNVNTATVTGAVVITTPILSSFMTTIRISGYNYLLNKTTIDLTVSFYAYASGIINHSFVNKGDYPISRVRIGRDTSGRAVIIINDVGTTWQYPALKVDTAQLSFTTPPDSYRSGWAMSFATVLPTLTVLAEVAGIDYKADREAMDAKIRADLRLTAPLPTSITQDASGITASTPTTGKYARLDYRGLFVLGGAIDIRTQTAANRGVILDALGLRGYNSLGVKVFDVDTNGNAMFAGDIVSSTDGTRGLRITGSGEVRALDPAYSGGRKLFDIGDTLPIVLDGNQSGGSVNPENFAKIYTRTFNVSIPAASYTTGSRIAINHLISDYTEVAIANVLTVQLAVASKEWRCYETDSASRVYGGGDLSAINLSVSPNFAYTSGGTTIQVTMLIVGMR